MGRRGHWPGWGPPGEHGGKPPGEHHGWGPPGEHPGWGPTGEHPGWGPTGEHHGWGPPGKHSWGPPGRGAQTWEGFGRRMVIGGLLFGLFLLFMFAAFGFLVVTLVGGLLGANLPGRFVLIPAGLAFLALLGARRISRTWRPVRQLIGAAGSLADGDYSVRVPGTSSSTMAPVVRSFNDMARRLETADAQRRRLLADLGHELRTPLTVIRGEIEAMIDGVHVPDQEHLEALIAEVGVMERLLEDLRTLSELEAGALALHREPTDVGQLLEDVADAHRRRAAEDGVLVTIRTGPGVGELDIDPVRMREVLTNLVMNSLRAMPDGGALRLSAAAEHGAVVIEVADTGLGIPAEELETVFDRFHKGEASPGSGLGLTISRDLVAAHGGSITLHSALGQGTTARIALRGPGRRGASAG